MKRKLGILTLSFLALAALSGCKGSEENYYRIEIYSDYEGMEADLANQGAYTHEGREAIHVGYCYALPGKDAKTGGIQVYLYDGKGYDYRVSTRTAPEGYEYSFKQLVGFYDADPQKPVDLEHISANCEVFATFETKPINYVVSVKDAFGANLYQAPIPFGSKVGDIPALSAVLNEFPVYDTQADPEDPTTWRTPYYNDYIPTYWNVTTVNADKSTEQSPMALDEDVINAFEITKKTTFEPVYAQALKHYTVTVTKFQLRTPSTNVNGVFEYAYEDLDWELPDPLVLEYGTDLAELPALQKEGYNLVAEGLNGVRTHFAASPSLPIELRDRVTGEPLSFDLHSLRYDCSIVLVYEKEAVKHTVTFAGTTGIDPATVVDGRSVLAPSKSSVVIPSGKSFTGLWAKQGETTPYDLSNIKETVTLEPIFADTSFDYQKDFLSPTFTYVFDEDALGYLVSNVAIAGSEEIAVTPSLFKPVEDFPELFPYLGISSFGEGRKLVSSLAVPEGTSILRSGCIARLDHVVNVDLRNATVEELPSQMFQNLARLESVQLPGTLSRVLGPMFNNCTSLTGIYLDMTQATYESYGTDAFPAGWNNGFPLTFKIA